MPIPPISHGSIIDRIYERKAPFGKSENRKDSGYKDFLLWSTVLELARANSGQKVVLVTADQGFWEGDALHRDLAADADEMDIILVKNLRAFHEEEVQPWSRSDEGLRNQLLGRLDDITAFIEYKLEDIPAWFPVHEADLPYASEEAQLANLDAVRTLKISTVTRLDDDNFVAAVVVRGRFGITDWYYPNDPWQLGQLEHARVDYQAEDMDQDHGMIFFTVDGVASFDLVFRIRDDENAQPTAVEITGLTITEPSP